MQILVTGATGFLGTALCSALEARGHALTRVSTRNCDLTRADSLSPFDGQEYHQIYHLAAWTQAGDFCLHHQGEQWIINQQINTNVLAWWQSRQPRAKLICMGSSCAYDPDQEHVESKYLVGLPIDSLFAYAMTKRMLYTGLLALHRQFGLTYLCLVPSTLYGPGYHTDGRQMHFIFDLIRKIIRGKLYGEPVVLWGDGLQSREVMFRDDFVAIARDLVDIAKNDLVNVGAGQEHTIRHYAELICRKVGYDYSDVQFDTSRYVGARSKCLGVGKLKTIAPVFSLTPLEAGVERTLEWFWQKRDVLFPRP